MTDEAKGKPEKHEGPASTSPYPMNRLSPRHDLVDLARELEKADAMLKATVGGKLETIVEQMRALRAQAERLLVEADRNARLHRAECRLQKRPGGVYHVYRRPNGTLYFSLLSPEEWGHAPPHAFEGSYRLEADMSFTPLAELDEREHRRDAVARLLGSARDEDG